MKIYLCGPISNNKNYKDQFAWVSELLVEYGHEVINPASIEFNPDDGWKEIMRKDISFMLQCDAVAIVNTCAPSTGQSIEMLVANLVGIPCKDFIEYM